MSERVRAFVAIELPEPVREGVASAIASAGQLPGKLGWVKRENWHLTLTFLGSSEPARLHELAAALETLAGNFVPFELALAASGVFPSPRRPAVLWVGLRESPVLGALQAGIDAAARALGWELESRRFHAHLTCARVKFAGPPGALASAWMAAQVPEPGWRVDAFSLMRSDSGPGGVRYTAMKSFALNG